MADIINRTMEQPHHNFESIASPETFWGVYDSYRALGTQMPQNIDRDIFHRHLDMLGTVEHLTPPELVHKLRGLLRNELGLTMHTAEPLLARDHFAAAMHHFRHTYTYNPDAEIRRQTVLALTDVLHARTGLEERRTHVLQAQTVQTLGRLIVTHSDLSHYSYDDGEHVYGALMETAFAATFLAHPHPRITYIGAPTTPRQDSPRQRKAAGDDTKLPYGEQGNPAADSNLYLYKGREAYAYASARLQIKASESVEPGTYDEDIIVLYGDRDLFVADIGELRDYGSQLAGYTPTETARPIEVAAANIDLALSLRDQHFEQPRLGSAS